MKTVDDLMGDLMNAAADVAKAFEAKGIRLTINQWDVLGHPIKATRADGSIIEGAPAVRAEIQRMREEQG